MAYIQIKSRITQIMSSPCMVCFDTYLAQMNYPVACSFFYRIDTSIVYPILDRYRLKIDPHLTYIAAHIHASEIMIIPDSNFSIENLMKALCEIVIYEAHAKN